MDVYKVVFNKNEAVSAELANHLAHNDIGFGEENGVVNWFAIESPDEQTAIEIANKVISLLWLAR